MISLVCLIDHSASMYSNAAFNQICYFFEDLKSEGPVIEEIRFSLITCGQEPPEQKVLLKEAALPNILEKLYQQELRGKADFRNTFNLVANFLKQLPQENKTIVLLMSDGFGDDEIVTSAEFKKWPEWNQLRQAKPGAVFYAFAPSEGSHYNMLRYFTGSNNEVFKDNNSLIAKIISNYGEQ